MTQNKAVPCNNPWFAVNLSFFFAGLGQCYCGARWHGLLIVITQIFFLGNTLWHLIAPGGYTLLGLGSGFAFLIIHAMNLFDVIENHRQKYPEENGHLPSRDVWQIVLFSRVFPPLGYLMMKKYSPAILVLLFMIITGALRRIHPYFMLLFPFITGGVVYHLFSFRNRETDGVSLGLRAGFSFSVFITLLCLIYFPLHFFLHECRPFYIPSDSMEPVLYVNDQVFVKPRSLSEYKIGDILVFHPPVDTTEYFAKRLIARENEWVEIRDGRIFINNQLIRNSTIADNDYYNRGTFGARGHAFHVPAGHVFFLGDNSQVSYDSRFFGPVPAQSIVGQAYKIYWPINHNRTLIGE